MGSVVLAADGDSFSEPVSRLCTVPSKDLIIRGCFSAIVVEYFKSSYSEHVNVLKESRQSVWTGDISKVGPAPRLLCCASKPTLCKATHGSSN